MGEILTFEVYSFLFVFLRMGSAIMFMPAFMTSYISERQRLSIALAITLVLTPFLKDKIVVPTDDFVMFMRIAMFEIVYGAFLGLFMQILFLALSLLGNVAGTAVGFANAQFFNPTTQTQSIVLESFFSIMAVTLIFIMNIHHFMLTAVIDSYEVLPFGSPLPVSDLSDFFVRTVNDSFVIGFRISAPFIAYTIIFYVGMGLFSRLMPQLNIFFLSIPLQIYLGLGLLLITTPIIIMWFLEYFQSGLMKFMM